MVRIQVSKRQGEHPWQQWAVSVDGYKDVPFERHYAALAHACYLERNPHVGERLN